MNQALKVCNFAWSAVSSIVTYGLFALFIFWAILQSPSAHLAQAPQNLVYSAHPGTTVYVENPLDGLDYESGFQIHVTLTEKNTGETYDLGVVEHYEQIAAAPGAPATQPARPAYPVRIPSFVQRGLYDYEAYVRYPLNVFKEAQVPLPTATMIVD